MYVCPSVPPSGKRKKKLYIIVNSSTVVVVILVVVLVLVLVFILVLIVLYKLSLWSLSRNKVVHPQDFVIVVIIFVVKCKL